MHNTNSFYLKGEMISKRNYIKNINDDSEFSSPMSKKINNYNESIIGDANHKQEVYMLF